MNSRLNKTLMSLAITACVISTSGTSILAADVNTAESQVIKAVEAGATVERFDPLTDTIDVQVKSIVNELTLAGTRIGMIVKMRNNSRLIARVPEYELRVKTREGTLYTLQPSAGNLKSIQPETESEFSFMSVVDRKDEVVLAEVNWTDVDYYVYPKKETLLISAPITVQSWKGGDTQITDPRALLKWTDVFTIPQSDSPIQYTPMDIHKESTDKGTVYVVQLSAYNPKEQRNTVPEFAVDAKSETKIFSGSRVEQAPIVLEAKERAYIHYVFPTDQDTLLTSLNILTPEIFAGKSTTDASHVQVQVGRLNILLPKVETKETPIPYVFGTSMSFDTRSELIHPQLQVSVVEFSSSDNEEEGNKMIMAKFLLSNHTERTLTTPAFQTALLSPDGYEYKGRRQTAAATDIQPNSSIIVNYSFLLPKSEDRQNFQLKLRDAINDTAYSSTIASYSIQLQPKTDKDMFSMYPFDVKVENWDLSFLFNSQLQYTYKGKFFLDIQRKHQTELDQSFPKLQFELYDGVGRLVGTANKAFIGPGRLVSGENNIAFVGSSEQFDSPLSLKLFEVFTTAAGDSKRLVAEFVK